MIKIVIGNMFDYPSEYLLVGSSVKLKKHTIKSATKENRKIDDSRMEEIADEIKKSKAKYLITLGNEPLVNFVKEYNPDIKPLDLKEQYGLVNDIRIDGFPIRLIPLVHPRQAGKLNHYSKEWNKKHNDWISTDAEKLKREIA